MATGLPDEFTKFVGDFSTTTDGICDKFADALSANPPPAVIYHYTDESGLRGILQSGKLWLTDIFCLNDPSELRHGIRLALDILRQEADKGPPELKLFHKNLAQVVTGNLEVTAHYFICCFSDTGEDLGQWRSYAADGRGYALGFDRKLLEGAFIHNGHGPSTFGMTYDDKKLSQLQKKLVAEAIPLISKPQGRNLSGEIISQYMAALSVKLTSACLMSSLFFKHPAYSNEKEFRFLEVHSAGKPIPDLKFRSRPYSLVRYREFDWKRFAGNSLTKIVIGPAADPKVASRFAYDCVREFASGNVAISQSEIPYRSVLQPFG